MQKQPYQTKANPIIDVLFGFIAVAFLISSIPGLAQAQQSETEKPYNLTKNPGEWINLYNNESCSETQSKLAKQLTDFFDRYANPRYDLWNGGSSKTLLDLVAVKKPI